MCRALTSLGVNHANEEHTQDQVLFYPWSPLTVHASGHVLTFLSFGKLVSSR